MSLRLQLLLLQAVIVCVVVGLTGVVAVTLQERQLREAYLDRMIGVAQSVARLPAIIDAYGSDDPSAVIQPIAEVTRIASGVTYVVVTDSSGIRYSHPDVERIGERVSTDPSVPLAGGTYVGTQTGTLGESWRVKVPVFAGTGEVIGSVSVGILEQTLRDDFLGGLTWLLITLCVAAVLGVLGAAGVASFIRRRIHRLEPREIATLVDSRDTMLHGLSEGVVSVDESGRIGLVNDAALMLLGLDEAALVGGAAAEVLEAPLLSVLEDGEREGRLVLAGERVLVARSTGFEHGRSRSGATLLLRDHTELHRILAEMDGAHSLTDGLRAQAHEFANKLHVISGLIELGLIADARAFITESTTGGPMAIPAHVAGQPELGALLMVKASQARELGISLSVGSSDAFLEASLGLSDRVRADLLTVVGNLVDNAIEACSAGNQVIVRFEMDQDGLVVGVEDDGDGVPDRLRTDIFQEGVSSKTRSGIRGRGIGLALVRRIAHRYRGEASVGTASLGGARFVVTLPVPTGAREPDEIPAAGAR